MWSRIFHTFVEPALKFVWESFWRNLMFSSTKSNILVKWKFLTGTYAWKIEIHWIISMLVLGYSMNIIDGMHNHCYAISENNFYQQCNEDKPGTEVHYKMKRASIPSCLIYSKPYSSPLLYWTLAYEGLQILLFLIQPSLSMLVDCQTHQFQPGFFKVLPWILSMRISVATLGLLHLN